MEQNTVEIKGWRNGVLLLLPPEIEGQELLTLLESRLDAARGERSFWRGAQTTLDFGDRAVSASEISEIVDFLKVKFGLIPVAVVSSQEATRAAAVKLVMKAYNELPIIRKPGQPAPPSPETEASTAETPPEAVTPAPPSTPPPPAAPTNNALYVSSTVRSGQRILHETGHMIICGDVNAGAEVIAAGDVVVVGTLRGVAHAGCFGDESARIVAGSLRPPQLRIAGKIARSEEEDTGRASGVAKQTEVARVENGEIRIFPL